LLNLLQATLPAINDAAGDVMVKQFLARSQLNVTKNSAIVCLTYPQAADGYSWTFTTRDSFWGGDKLPWLRMSGGAPPLLLRAFMVWTEIALRLLRSYTKMYQYIPSLVNPLKPKRRPLYLKTQSVLRC